MYLLGCRMVGTTLSEQADVTYLIEWVKRQGMLILCMSVTVTSLVDHHSMHDARQ